MIKKRNLSFVIILSFFFFLQTLPAWSQTKKKDNSVELTILYTTDMYGQFRDFRCKRPGIKDDSYSPAKVDISNLLAMVDKVRKDVVQKRGQVPPLLFNTGDNLGSSLPVRFLLEFEGLAGVDFIARVFKRFGFNLIGLGNHEFTPGPEKLAAFLSQSFIKGLRFAASNLDIPTDAKQLALFKKHAISKYVNDVTNKKPYFVFEPEKGGIKTGIKIGVFHLVPGSLQNKVAKRTVRGIKFKDPSDVISDIVTKLRETEKVDIVIMLSHLESSRTKGKTVRELISHNEGIDLVITNSFTYKKKAQAISIFDRKGKGVYVVSGTKFGTQLGKVVLKVKKEKGDEKAKILAFQPGAIPLKNDVFDPELRRELIKWEASYCKRWAVPLGQGRIRKGFEMSHKQFGLYLTNLIRYLTKTDVSFINARAIRNSKFTTSDGDEVTKPFPIKGYITKDDIYRALAFDQGFQIIRVKGSTLSSLIESHAGDDKGSKEIYFAGVNDGNINGREIQSERWYTAVTIDYLANGRLGDLKLKKKQKSSFNFQGGQRVMLREFIIQHFVRNKYRKLPAAPAPKKDDDDDDDDSKKPKAAPQPFTNMEIPFTGAFYNLEDKWAWRFKTEFDIGGNATFTSPMNLTTFEGNYGNDVNENFTKIQGTTSLKLEMEIDKGPHKIDWKLNLSYSMFMAQQWSNSPSPGQPKESFFQEDSENDTFEFAATYTWKTTQSEPKWYIPDPNVSFEMNTKITRGTRPDITGDGLIVQPKEQDLLRYFDLTSSTALNRPLSINAKLGAAWKLGSDRDLNLDIKVGWARQLVLQSCLKTQDANGDVAICENETDTERKKLYDAKIQELSLDQSNQLTITVKYSHEGFSIGKIREKDIQWNFSSEYLLTVSIDTTSTSPGIRDNHRLEMETDIAFELQGNISLSVGFKMLMMIYYIKPEGQTLWSRGPFGFSFLPNVKFKFGWGTRGQAF